MVDVPDLSDKFYQLPELEKPAGELPEPFFEKVQSYIDEYRQRFGIFCQKCGHEFAGSLEDIGSEGESSSTEPDSPNGNVTGSSTTKSGGEPPNSSQAEEFAESFRKEERRRILDLIDQIKRKHRIDESVDGIKPPNDYSKGYRDALKELKESIKQKDADSEIRLSEEYQGMSGSEIVDKVREEKTLSEEDVEKKDAEVEQ